MAYSWKFKADQFSKTSPTYVAYCRAFSLLDKIRELKAEKKSSLEGPEKLLGVMSTLTEGCIRKITKLDNELSLNRVNLMQRKNIENTIRTILLSVNILHAFLRYIDATRLSRNPTGMIKPWELLIRKYGGELNIIIRPQWKYNYSYYNMVTILKKINDIIRDQETELELQEIGLYFPILSFAGLERDNVLLHIILAHEIGHLIDEIRKISSLEKHGDKIIETLNTPPVSDKLNRLYDLSVNIMKTLKTKLQETPGVTYELFIEHEAKSEAQTELVNKIITWLEEITADIIAVRIIGPSFIFALYQTQLAQVSKMGPAGDYPPPQIRIENCIEYWNTLDKEDKFFDPKTTDTDGCQSIKECVRKYLDDIKQKETETLPEPSVIDKLQKERYNLLTEILVDVVKNPISSIKESIARCIEPFKLDDGVFRLIELLKDRITPVRSEGKKVDSSTRPECDIASILNASWIFWLTHERDIAPGEEGTKTEEVASLDKLRISYYEPLVEISHLILKGIELADFDKQFSDLKQRHKSTRNS